MGWIQGEMLFREAQAIAKAEARFIHKDTILDCLVDLESHARISDEKQDGSERDGFISVCANYSVTISRAIVMVTCYLPTKTRLGITQFIVTLDGNRKIIISRRKDSQCFCLISEQY